MEERQVREYTAWRRDRSENTQHGGETGQRVHSMEEIQVREYTKWRRDRSAWSELSEAKSSV